MPGWVKALLDALMALLGYAPKAPDGLPVTQQLGAAQAQLQETAQNDQIVAKATTVRAATDAQLLREPEPDLRQADPDSRT